MISTLATNKNSLKTQTLFIGKKDSKVVERERER
jgi:hypothetical protein